MPKKGKTKPELHTWYTAAKRLKSEDYYKFGASLGCTARSHLKENKIEPFKKMVIGWYI